MPRRSREPVRQPRGSGRCSAVLTRRRHSQPRQGPRDRAAVNTSQRVIGLPPSLRPTPAHKRCTAEIALNYDQGGACGAAGPALAPASGLREAPAVVARRATPLGQQIKAAYLRAGHTADSRLPRRTSVQLAVAASRAAPLGPSPRRSALADPGPGAHSQVDQRLSRKTGAERARPITARRESTVRELSPPAA